MSDCEVGHFYYICDWKINNIMLCISYYLSENVSLHELPSGSGTISCTAPFLRKMVEFLEKIRKQSFPCHIMCDRDYEQGCYFYLKAHNVGVIRVQNYKDFRILIYQVTHELCHYIMDNHNSYPWGVAGRKLSSFEEVFANMASVHFMKSFVIWCRQELNPQTADLMAQFLAALHRQHQPLIEVCRQKGIEAIPLLNSELLPDYDNCMAIAFLLQPYFEKHPALWEILPFVQNVNPQSLWADFLDRIEGCPECPDRNVVSILRSLLHP